MIADLASMYSALINNVYFSVTTFSHFLLYFLRYSWLKM